MENKSFYVVGDEALLEAVVTKLKGYPEYSPKNNDTVLAVYPKYKVYQFIPRPQGETYYLPKDWDTVMELIEPKVEYVRCVNSLHKTYYTEGKIYKLLEPPGKSISLIADNGTKITDIINWTTDYPNNNTFSPSTKEEFDQQELIKVGDYVVVERVNPLYCHRPNTQIGDIFKVGYTASTDYVEVGFWVGEKEEGTSIGSNFVRKATAQEIEAYNSTIVEGYKAKVKDNKIKFGCQYISKQTLLELRSLLQNRSITIGETELTEELLTKLINKL